MGEVTWWCFQLCHALPLILSKEIQGSDWLSVIAICVCNFILFYCHQCFVNERN